MTKEEFIEKWASIIFAADDPPKTGPRATMEADLQTVLAKQDQHWKSALQAADNRYHALRQAAVYAEAAGADPEMIKGWKRTLWNSPESQWPNLTPEADRMRMKLAENK